MQSYYRTATLPLLRSYFSCLFRALTATHNLHIIHRDVKPANFLYDITTGDAVLCDYGLAQKIGGDEWFEWKSDCLHSLPGPTWGGLEGRARSQRKLEKNTAAGCCPGLSAGLHGVKLAKPLSLYEQATAMEREWAKELDVLERRDDEGLVEEHEWKQLDAIKPWTMPPGWRPDIKGRMHDRQAFLKSWRSALDVAKQKGKQRPGILKDDRRYVRLSSLLSVVLLTPRPPTDQASAPTAPVRGGSVHPKFCSNVPTRPSVRPPPPHSLSSFTLTYSRRSPRHLVVRNHPSLLPHPPLPLLQLERRHRSSRGDHRHLR